MAAMVISVRNQYHYRNRMKGEEAAQPFVKNKSYTLFLLKIFVPGSRKC